MKRYLDKIRKSENKISYIKYFINSILIFIIGAVLGIVSKYLDIIPSNELLSILEKLDIRNFLSGFSLWLLVAITISVYSNTFFRAGINVFLFFTGMLLGYYFITKNIAGFLPVNYVIIWVILTLISPLLAFICWYAKGEGNVALLLSGIIIGVFLSQVVVFGIFYTDIISLMDLIAWLICVFIFYKKPNQLLKMLVISIFISVIYNFISPFGY
ncbi:hypothetical protein [Miniphocaeibacter massiliensis]|uniref:hypothetical protein n=1 Tax=Miniphocaeibacter massiliensis TaxID=2041841 RepID=UPI000C1BEF8E|nr:hypothetical protein [Miniphocaeibacter massiliensis]